MAGPRSTILPLKGGSSFADFNDSGFYRCEAVSGLAPTNFNYPIHTFFRRCNFPEVDIVYDKIQLSLRLATAFMVAGLPVFHAILCGRIEQIEGTAERGQPLYKLPAPLERLTEDQKTLTWVLLNQIAEQTTFHLDAATTCLAYCGSFDASAGCFAPAMPGCRCQIFISEAVYDALAEAYDDPGDVICHQSRAFLLAATLVHELAHLIAFAALPISLHDAEIFLGDGKTTELGFEMESYLFDGMTPEGAFHRKLLHFDIDTMRYSKLDMLLVATEYPCASKKLVYDTDFTAFAVRGADPSMDVFYNMSFLWIHKMFQDSFWRSEFVEKGRKALWFEKKTGYCFQVNDKSSRTPVKAIGSPATFDIPEVFWADDHGLICRFDEASVVPTAADHGEKANETSRNSQDVAERAPDKKRRRRGFRKKIGGSSFLRALFRH